MTRHCLPSRYNNTLHPCCQGILGGSPTLGLNRSPSVHIWIYVTVILWVVQVQGSTASSPIQVDKFRTAM